jgi:hypothetical protein
MSDFDSGYEAGRRAGLARAASIAEREAGLNGMYVFGGDYCPDPTLIQIRDRIMAELDTASPDVLPEGEKP